MVGREEPVVEVVSYKPEMGEVPSAFKEEDPTLGRTVLLINGTPVLRGYRAYIEQQAGFVRSAIRLGPGQPINPFTALDRPVQVAIKRYVGPGHYTYEGGEPAHSTPSSGQASESGNPGVTPDEEKLVMDYLWDHPQSSLYQVSDGVALTRLTTQKILDHLHRKGWLITTQSAGGLVRYEPADYRRWKAERSGHASESGNPGASDNPRYVRPSGLSADLSHYTEDSLTYELHDRHSTRRTADRHAADLQTPEGTAYKPKMTVAKVIDLGTGERLRYGVYTRPESGSATPCGVSCPECTSSEGCPGSETVGKLVYGAEMGGPDATEFGERIYGVLSKRAVERAVNFKANVHAWIQKCQEAGGTPMFRTRYASKRFPEGIVLGTCWGSAGAVRGKWFKEVPREDIEMMEARTGDWRWIIEKYGASRVGLSADGRTYTEAGKVYELYDAFEKRTAAEAAAKEYETPAGSIYPPPTLTEARAVDLGSEAGRLRWGVFTRKKTGGAATPTGEDDYRERLKKWYPEG